MRITPVSIEIQGFRSFGASQTLTFAQRPGLCNLSGANGSGKSSIWDALNWVQYGKSSRGLLSPALHNWSGEFPLRVRFRFLCDGEPAWLERTWKPVMRIVRCLNGQERQLSQEELEAWLGMDMDVFSQSVLVGQFSKMFLEYGATDKQKFLSTLLRSERWERYLEYASRKAKEISRAQLKAQAELEAEKMSQKRLTEEYESYQQKSLNWEAERQQRLTSTASTKTAQQAELATIENAKSTYIANFTVEDLAATQEKIQVLRDRNAKHQTNIDALNLVIGEAQGRLKSLKALKQKLELLSAAGYLCPTCGQKADAKHIVDEQSRYDAEIQEVSAAITQNTQEKTRFVGIQQQNSVKASELETRCREIDRAKAEYQRRLTAFDTNIAKTQAQIQITDQQQQRIASETNHFEPLIREKLEAVRTSNEQIFRLDGEVKSLVFQAQLQDFWQKGFREIQLFLIAEVTAQLEMAYNAALSSLGLPQWKFKLSVENETKSGTIQNKFIVSILPPGRTEAVPLEAWSGGETHRLRLACAFGTFDLVRQLTGVAWDLEVWDEPGPYLSEEGVENLLNVLRQRASVLGKQVWLIDHRNVAYAAFDYHIAISKNEAGSIIES